MVLDRSTTLGYPIDSQPNPRYLRNSSEMTQTAVSPLWRPKKSPESMKTGNQRVVHRHARVPLRRQVR